MALSLARAFIFWLLRPAFRSGYIFRERSQRGGGRDGVAVSCAPLAPARVCVDD
jgi:hypothetical protein